MLNKKFQFSFTFYETGAFIDLDFDTFEQALKSAKFHCEAFIEEAYRRAIKDRNIQSTHDEYKKIADDFILTPNEEDFSFSDYFVTYYNFLRFSEEMENIWRGMADSHGAFSNI